MGLAKFIMFILACAAMNFLSVVSASSKQLDNCAVIKQRKQVIEKRITNLSKTYPDEMSFYGFSAYMVRGATHEDSGNYILKIADLVQGCTKLIEGKTCDLAAKEIMEMISGGLKICLANKKVNCGVC